MRPYPQVSFQHLSTPRCRSSIRERLWSASTGDKRDTEVKLNNRMELTFDRNYLLMDIDD